MTALLTIEDYRLAFDTSTAPCRSSTASIWRSRPGETLGIVGETGCGKTVLARSLLG